jgi:hypothetical protein
MQQIDSGGSPLGANARLAGSAIGGDLVDPKLATDSAGTIYLFYRDQTSGLIWGGTFDEDLKPIRPLAVTNNSISGSFAGPFDFDVYPDGKIVIAWEEYASGVPAVMVKMLDPNGSTITGPVAADEASGANAWVPTVAVDPSSGFIVVWEDYRQGVADIVAQLFTAVGAKNGVNFMVVPPPANAAAQFAPEIICTGPESYVIGWIDQRAGQQVMAQRVTVNSGLVGDNVPLSSHDPESLGWDLDLADATTETLVATWASFGPQNRIISLTLDEEMVPQGPSRQLDEAVAGQRWAPAVSCNCGGERLTVWTEVAGSDPDIAALRGDPTGVPLPGSYRVLNDDLRGAASTDPVVVPTTDWYNLVCFSDRRNDAGDIYVQMVSNFGTLLGPNTRVNQDVEPNLQSDPTVVAARDRALVLWIDHRAVNTIPGQRIFGRFCSPLGQFTDDEILISAADEPGAKSSLEAVMTPAGRGLVAWIDSRLGTPQVYGRWLADDGSFTEAEFLVSDPLVDMATSDLQLGLDSSGGAYVMWLESSSLPARLRVKWFNPDLTEGGEFTWSAGGSGLGMAELAAGVLSDGNIVVLFTGGEAARQLFFSVRARDGSVVVPVTAVTDHALASPGSPVLAVSNHDHLVFAWEDHRQGRKNVYYRVLDATFAPLEPSQAISNVVTDYLESPAVSALNGRAWITWSDPRQDGPNIYASAVLYQPLSVDDPLDGERPGEYHLAQNYPNPFNPSTEISFTLETGATVTLTVFNVLGQSVSTLVDGYYPAGTHTVRWNADQSGSDVASGIYLYRLESDEISETRKMMLLK